MKILSNAHFRVFSAIGKYEFITATVSIDYQEKYPILKIDSILRTPKTISQNKIDLYQNNFI